MDLEKRVGELETLVKLKDAVPEDVVEHIVDLTPKNSLLSDLREEALKSIKDVVYTPFVQKWMNEHHNKMMDAVRKRIKSWSEDRVQGGYAENFQDEDNPERFYFYFCYHYETPIGSIIEYRNLRDYLTLFCGFTNVYLSQISGRKERLDIEFRLK